MSRTTTRSEVKSNVSLRSLTQNLNPNGETNFWKFYLDNKSACDKIIDVQIQWHVFDEENRKDAHQEVLMSLERCGILSGYEAERGAAFNTYFTNTVRGHISRYINKQRTPTWNPYFKLQEYLNNRTKKHLSYVTDDAEGLRFERFYSHAFNGVCVDKYESSKGDDYRVHSLELSQDTDIESTYEIEIVVQLLRNKLHSKLIPIFDYVLAGFTNADIAKILKVSDTMVGRYVKKIRDIGYKL